MRSGDFMGHPLGKPFELLPSDFGELSDFLIWRTVCGVAEGATEGEGALRCEEDCGCKKAARPMWVRAAW